MSFDADIAVVGAGPAGARAAELLALQGANVVLLDPKAPWEKPCGGGMTSSVLTYVPELEPLLATARRVETARIENDRGHGFQVPLSRPIYVIDRRRLAEWQMDRACSAGARFSSAKVQRVERGPNGWTLSTRSGEELVVRSIVGADGAASTVRRAVAPSFDIERAPTRVAYPAVGASTDDVMLFRFYGGFDGYLWDFPRTAQRSVGIGVLGESPPRTLLDAEIDGYRAEVDGPESAPVSRAGAVIGTAQAAHGDYSAIGGPDFALLGDAAGFADPATGEGIQNALRSAGVVARAYAVDAGFATYPRLARREFEGEFRIARMTRRILIRDGRAAWVIALAAARPWAYALVWALSNAINEHDGSVPRLARRWARALRAPPARRAAPAPG